MAILWAKRVVRQLIYRPLLLLQFAQHRDSLAAAILLRPTLFLISPRHMSPTVTLISIVLTDLPSSVFLADK